MASLVRGILHGFPYLVCAILHRFPYLLSCLLRALLRVLCRTRHASRIASHTTVWG